MVPLPVLCVPYLHPILCVQGSTTCPLCSLATPLFSVFRVPPPVLCVPWLHPYSLCSGFHHLSSVFLGYTPILYVQGSTTYTLCSLATPLFSMFRVPPPVLCVPWLHPCPLVFRSGPPPSRLMDCRRDQGRQRKKYLLSKHFSFYTLLFRLCYFCRVEWFGLFSK
jgi:hypothetical protein